MYVVYGWWWTDTDPRRLRVAVDILRRRKLQWVYTNVL
jgi:hypothetical protein